MKKLFLLLVLVAISFLAFSQKEKKQDDSKQDKELVEKQTNIIFDKLIYDFGTLNQGDDATCVFKFKNVSKKAVKLTNVKTSCGCTAAEWPRENIAKRKKGEISIKYDSNRIGNFHKTIKVYVEGNENPIQLEIKGTIVTTNQNEQAPQKVTRDVSAPKQQVKQQVKQQNAPKELKIIDEKN